MTIIKTSHLTKIFGDTVAIRDLNMEIPSGSIYGFLGENGAGKSTTLKILSGLHYPTSGSVKIFGKELSSDRLVIADRMGVLIETPGFIPYLTGRQVLRQLARLKGVTSSDIIDELIALVNIEYAVDRNVGHYSTGMKQRLGLAQALLNEPELILLDEPFSGLDVKGVLEIKSLLTRLNSELGVTILLSSHRLREIEKLCTDAMVIRQGRMIAQGSIESLLPETSALSIEVSDANKASEVLKREDIPHRILDGSWLKVDLNGTDRRQLVSLLNAENISIYYLNNEDKMTLEDLYLSYNREEAIA